MKPRSKPSKGLHALSQGLNFVKSTLLDGRPSVAYVGGWLGQKNLGDDALFEAYKLLFPEFNLVHFDGGRVARQIAKRSPRLKAGVLAGGTLIGHKREWLEIAKAFLEICPNLYIFGTGVEEQAFWPGETSVSDWKPVLERCRFLGVRGPSSRDSLLSAGFDEAKVVGDPVVAFATAEVNRSPVAKSIGLNIGTSDGKVWGNEQRIRDEMASLAKRAKEAGWRVEWYVVWPKDLEITLQAAVASGTSEHVRVICEDHHLFMERVRDLTAFVGMKLHATVFATCALTPSVMLEYRPKCRDFMQSIHQESVTFQTDSFEAEKVWEIVQEWNEHRPEVAARLATAVHALQAAQRSAAVEISAEISNIR